MRQDWLVYNLYVKSPDMVEEMLGLMRLFAEELRSRGLLTSYYFNQYFIPPNIGPYLRFGYYRLADRQPVENKIQDMVKEGRISKVDEVDPDLTNVDGVEMDKIKLAAREITDVIRKDLGKKITTSQAGYLIHLFMNHFFGYSEEREIYSNLTASIEKAMKSHGIQ